MEGINKRIFLFAVIVSGVTAMTGQLVLLKEFLSVFNGNELIIGILLCNWLLLTGTGAYIAGLITKTKQLKLLIILQSLLSVTPILSLFFLLYTKNDFFIRGSMIDIKDTLIYSFIFLSPVCLLSGSLFTIFSSFFISLGKAQAISRIYYYETIGSIAGGLVINCALIFILGSFDILRILFLLNIFSAFLLINLSEYTYKRLLKFIVALVFISLSFFIFTFDFKKLTNEKLFKEQEVIYSKDTPYGNITVTEVAEQKNFYNDGVFLYSTTNLIQKEEDVHYAIVQHKQPKNILLVSGGISGTVEEILKYKVDNIDYLEINPWLSKIGTKYNKNLLNKKINIINKDALAFIKETDNLYDVALINVSPPTTAMLNRYYTIEFYTEIKKHLNKDGVISLALMSGTDYMSKEAIQVNSVIYKTLASVFKNIIIIPASKNYFICSDKTLSLNIPELIENKNIENLYVNKYYIDYNDIKRRSEMVINSLNNTKEINTDFKPVAYYNQLIYWLSYFRNFYLPYIIIIIVFIIIFFLISKPIHFSLFSAGFTATSVEFILLVFFSVFFGNIYLMLGLLISFFMLGMLIGVKATDIIISSFKASSYSLIQLLLAIYTIALPLIFYLLNEYSINSLLIKLIFIFIITDIGAITGLLFSYAVRLQGQQKTMLAARSYSSDLVGSALGVLLVSALLLPLLGLTITCLIIGSLNILAVIRIRFNK